MLRTLRAVRFLFVGPVIVVALFFINVFASPGEWWFQWAALGIGIAWFICLIRVVTAAVVVGGIAALIATLRRRGTFKLRPVPWDGFHGFRPEAPRPYQRGAER